MTKPEPTGPTRWLFNAPVSIFRARLGFLFGHRFLMIEHLGRKSQKLRRTVLEVVHRDEASGEWFVVSGFGPRADWYQNLRAGGLQAVWIGSRRCPMEARFLEPGEAAAMMARYEEAHPKTAEILMGQLGVGHDGTDEGRVAMMAEIPMVAFRIIR